ncbi:hypothetical protein XAP7430_260083 [Xanthomonas phaseoli pv. phaseoli]|uniref:Uncharacterized protein n=1 Tax=Xanthomonas campestris pv. phaseoli TaxID=317013 RepID=A0AB38DYC0_XANCH|nr:hypothetical protein XAP7430_260083 [Xanthomonas phaseoli pv. phaseoli]
MRIRRDGMPSVAGIGSGRVIRSARLRRFLERLAARRLASGRDRRLIAGTMAAGTVTCGDAGSLRGAQFLAVLGEPCGCSYGLARCASRCGRWLPVRRNPPPMSAIRLLPLIEMRRSTMRTRSRWNRRVRSG